MRQAYNLPAKVQSFFTGLADGSSNQEDTKADLIYMELIHISLSYTNNKGSLVESKCQHKDFKKTRMMTLYISTTRIMTRSRIKISLSQGLKLVRRCPN